MKKTVRLLKILFCILYFFTASIFITQAYAASGINRTIPFQGRVVNKTDGTNITNGSYTFIFKLYDASSSGNQLWSETQSSVAVTNGIFSVNLGSVTSLAAVDFNQDNIWLDVTFNGEAFGSRVRLGAAAYAFTADKLNGVTATQSATGYTLTGGYQTLKTLTVSDNTTLGTNSITLAGGEVVTFTAANALTFTTSGTTNVTFPSGSVTMVDTTTSQNLTSKTYNGLSVTGSDPILIQPTSTVGITLQSNGAKTVTIDTGAAAAINIGASANGITIGNNSLTNNTSVTLTTGGSGLLTLGSNTGTGNVLIQPNAGGQAALMVKNNGVGDLFTASAGATTRFVLTNGGNISLVSGANIDTIAASGTINLGGGANTATLNISKSGGAVNFLNFATNNNSVLVTGASGLLSAITTTTAGQCLTSNASGNTPSWGSCNGGSSLWNLTSGALTPWYSTNDLLIGGTSTASAKFAFINNTGSGTPTASISAGVAGGLYLTAAGNIQTTAFQPLAIGGSTTGAITIGTTGSQAQNITIGSTTGASALSLQSGTGNITIGANNNPGNITIQTGSTSTGLIVNKQSSIGNIFDAKVSGTTMFSIQNNGDVAIGTSSAQQLLDLYVANGDAGIKFANPVITSSGPNNGGTFANDASVGTTTWTSPSNAQTNNTTYATAINLNLATSQYLKATNFSFAVPANAVITGILLEVKKYQSAGTGNIIDNSVRLVKNGTITGTDKSDNSNAWPTTDPGTYVSYGGSTDMWGQTWVPADVNASTFGAVLAAQEGIGFNATAAVDHMRITVYYYTSRTQFVEGIQSSSGLFKISGSGSFGTNDYLTINTSGAVAFSGAFGSASQCLTSNGSASAPTWGSCGGTWNLTSGALTPWYSTNDLLIGGTSTASAKFAFINNTGSGTPTASISAGVAGGLYLTAAGNIQTTAFQSLSLGGSTTGNIILGANTGTSNVLIQPNAGGQAGLIINDQGVGDLFTASASGTTRFRVANNGSVLFQGDVIAASGSGNLGGSTAIVNALGDQGSLVPNAGFEAAISGQSFADGWITAATSSATVSRDTSANNFAKGTAATKIVTTNTNQSLAFYSACIPLAGQGNYNLFYYQKGSAANVATVRAYVDQYTTKTNCVSNISPIFSAPAGTSALTNAFASVGLAGYTGATNGWSTTTTWGRVHFYIASAVNGASVWIDGVRLIQNSTSVGVDYAENYSADPTHLPEAGDVVELVSVNGDALVKPANSTDGQSIIGIVSSNPGEVLDDGTTTYQKVPIALAGRIPTKVSTENGSIAIGDYLTASDIPGVAVKAVSSGQVVGIAMENYTEQDTTKIGKVITFVKNTYYSGSSGLAGVNAGIADLIGKPYSSNASLSDTAATTSADLLSQLATSSGEVSISGLSVNGLATVSADLRVKGNSLIEGILTVVDTLQTSNFLVNKVADFFGSVFFHSNVTFSGTPTFNTDTAGYITIPKGSASIDITFNKPYEKTPVVVATLLPNDQITGTPSADITKTFFTDGYAYTITNRSEKGFSLVLNKPAVDDIFFSWIALITQQGTVQSVAGSETTVISPTPSTTK